MARSQDFLDRLDMFETALSRLEEALSLAENEVVRDASIQRFEFTFELAWKSMRLWLRERGIDVRNPRDTLRAAFEQGLIEDAAEWSDLQEKRNLTSHTYDRELAETVYRYLKAHALPLFRSTLERMKADDG